MPRLTLPNSVAMAIALLATMALGACSGTGETREPGADRTRVTYRCSDRQVIRVLYDYTVPSAPVARVVVKGQTFEMRSIRSQPGSARYSTESGLRPTHGLQWWTRGDQATLSEMLLDHTAPEPTRIASCVVSRNL
jgi:membrane-bound inhibitor of C-type lysozyme